MIEDELLSRITRDISDGLIVVDMHGKVALINPAAYKLLELSESEHDEEYKIAVEDRFVSEFDEFNQFILDAIYDKGSAHTGVISLTTGNGNRKHFKMTTSFLFGKDGKDKEGVVVHFTDITEAHNLKIKTEESSWVFVILMGAICGWVFVYELWAFHGQPVSSALLTTLVEVFGFAIFVVLLKKTSITVQDLGLSTRGAGKYIVIDAAFTAGAFLILLCVKLHLLRIQPGAFAQQTVFNFGMLNWSSYMYPITVVVQEFLTRGVVQGSINKILTSNDKDFWSIFVSSLFFGALHIHKGLYFMCGAVILLSVFGIIYRRQKTIWGLCIPHYVLGMCLPLLFEIG